MDQIFDSLNKIEKNRKVIVYCNSGRKGAAVVHILRKNFNLITYTTLRRISKIS